MPEETNPIPEFTFSDAPITEPDTVEKTEEPQGADVQQEAPVSVEAETSPQAAEQEVRERIESDPGDAEEGIDERYLDLWRFYRNEGLHTLPVEREPATNEEFMNALMHQRLFEAEQAQKHILESAPDFGREVVDYIFRRGDELTPDELYGFMQNHAAYRSIDPEQIDSEDVAREYLRGVYADRGEPEEDIPDMLDVLADKGKLIDRARKYAAEEAEDAKAWEQEQLQKAEEAKAQEAEMVRQLDHHVRSYLDNAPWQPDLKQAVYDNIFSQRLRQTTQELVYYPVALAQLSNYMLHFDPERGIIDEELWKKQALTPQVKNVKDRLEKSFSSSGAGVRGTKKSAKQAQAKPGDFEFAD